MLLQAPSTLELHKLILFWHGLGLLAPFGWLKLPARQCMTTTVCLPTALILQLTGMHSLIPGQLHAHVQLQANS